MDIEILHGPSNAAARVRLEPGETLTAEGGSMISMSGHMNITTSTHKRQSGGILKAMKRMLAGENFFLNHYRCHGEAGEVLLATALSGDMFVHELQGDSLTVQSGSFVAADHNVDMDFNWQGFGKALFSGEAPFWLEMSGVGKVVINAFGAIYPIQVDGEVIVDTGHIVAFTPGLKFNITKAGGSWMTAILGGEGLVCKFQGQGTVWCQSHNATSFGQTLGPKLKPRSN